MPILVKTDDVRSGRKANARHGRHRITTFNIVWKLASVSARLQIPLSAALSKPITAVETPGKTLMFSCARRWGLLESSLRKASRLLRWDILGENWTLLNQKHKKARERGWRKNHHGGCSSKGNAKSWWTNHGFWRLSGLVNSRTSYRSK